MNHATEPAPAKPLGEAALSPRAALALRVHRGELTEEQAWRELKRLQHEGGARPRDHKEKP